MTEYFKIRKLKFLALLSVIFLVSSLGISLELNDQTDWNSGQYNGTAYNSGSSQDSLKIGYLDGTNPNADDSLETFWKFEQNLLDSSGNSVDGTSSNNISYHDGILNGQSASFSSNNATYAGYPDSSELNTQDFTFSAWIYPTDVSGFHPIISKETSSDRGYELAIDNYFSVPRLALTIQSSKDGEQIPRTEEAVPANEWVHVAATYDNATGNVDLYINGKNKTLYDGQYSDDPPYTYDNEDTNNLLVGATSTGSGGDYFEGRIDEVRIFSEPYGMEKINNETFYKNSSTLRGEYSSNTAQKSLNGEWYEAEFNSTVGNQNKLSAEFQALDQNDQILGSEIFSLTGGTQSFSLDINGSNQGDLDFKGNTTNPESSWEIDNATVDFAGLKLNEPSNNIDIVGSDVSFDFSIDSTETGNANLTLNGSTEQQYNVNKGFENFNSDIPLSTGEYNWSVEFRTTSGKEFSTKNRSFSFEEGKIAFEKIKPENDTRQYSNDLDFVYNITSDVDASIELIVDGNVESTDSINTGEQLRFDKTVNLAEDTHEWYLRANYTENSQQKTQESKNTFFSIYDRKTLNASSDFIDGSFQRTFTSDTAQDNLTTGYLSPQNSFNASYPNDKLSAFWRMENTGTLTDYSLNSNQGTTNNGMTEIDGVFGGTALGFDPTNENYVEVVDDSTLNQQSFTFSGWIYKEFSGQSEVPIIQKSSAGSSGYELLIDDYFGVDRLALFVYSSADGTQRFRTDTSVPSNEWVHVAATFDGENATLYINGEEKALASDASPATKDQNTNDLLLGASSKASGGSYFEGRIDELMIFNKSLNTTEIEETAIKPDNGYYKSNFSTAVKENQAFEWKEARVNSTIPPGNNLELQIQVRGQEDTINLDGSNSFRDINVPFGTKADIKVKGETDDPTESWSIQSIELNRQSKDVDLRVDSVSIPGQPAENNQTPVDITISNQGDDDISNIEVETSVQAYNESGEWQEKRNIKTTADLNSGQTKTMTEKIDFDTGPNKVRAEIDPENLIQGYSDSKNKQEIVDVSSYSLYHGETDIQVRLKTTNNNFTLLDSAKSYGNIYFSDTDTDYLHSNLRPLNSSGDLTEADQSLNISYHNDSLSEEYDEDQDGLPDNFKRMDVGGTEHDVPIINSTIYGNFKTGLMYDSSQKNLYDGSQDLVIVTEVNDSAQGRYGVYDYEVKVPSALKRLSSSTDKVDIYTDLPD